MSLIDEMQKKCITLEKTRTADGLGGYKTAWVPGVEFDALFEFDGSPETVIAEKQGVARSYGIYVDKAFDMDFHDVFKRIEDGQIFRVTDTGVDKYTPDSSTLGMRLLRAERWELPDA